MQKNWKYILPFILAHPENGTLKLYQNAKRQHLEWQIWVGLNNDTDLTNYELIIDKQKVSTISKSLNGLSLELKEKWISNKILSVKLFLCLEQLEGITGKGHFLKCKLVKSQSPKICTLQR